MHRRMGMEGFLGSGGGRISQDSLENLEIAEDLCRRRRPREAVPYLEKAMKDPRNLDAWVQAAFLAPNLGESTECLLFAEKQGRKFLEKDLGPKTFADAANGGHVGRFWGLLETRPYMRVLQALVQIHVENKKHSAAADVCVEMLRLCHNDNLGQRDQVGMLLAMAGRFDEALSFAQAYIADPASHPDGKTPPRQAPLTTQAMETMSDYTKADLLYTAALAAFRLWGDCELARQYLLIGARLNPQILLKILAKVDKPKSLSNSARAMNSTEDAHDYLWLAQDAWMAPDVWAWADSNTEAKTSLMKICSRDECTKKEERVAQFKRCSACHQVWYCSTACQKADWQMHKPACKEYEKTKKWRRMMAQGVAPPVAGGAAEFTAGGVAAQYF